ncbi:phosphatase 2c [Ascosphaera apis ARSEF 7405]|uniref:Phosphatase 2c n=1 Tax=Ascosphaera apis ARSEF 7405 TaxID=392613 RepID=A0A168AMS1_9EURO|nr:phosphatase 2c [Ascosphaera apis ARSEF 7405]
MLSAELKRIQIRKRWTLLDSYCFIARFLCRHESQSAGAGSGPPSGDCPLPSHLSAIPVREFHDYFVTHLPSSSLHHERTPIYNKLPRSASVPHRENPRSAPHAALQAPAVTTRDTTVVRIPLRSAKHHFGVAISRGNRLTNEDTYQAGVIDIPAFAKRAPRSLTLAERRAAAENSVNVADNANSDPQVFYYGVFDGHGGAECSEFLRERLHEYIQEAAAEFELGSSLQRSRQPGLNIRTQSTLAKAGRNPTYLEGEKPLVQPANRLKLGEAETELVKRYRSLIGGYYRRFRPAHFKYDAQDLSNDFGTANEPRYREGASMEEILEYAFLKADLDFVSAQAYKQDEDDIVQADQPLNECDILYSPSRLRPHDPDARPIGGPKRFKGGSTASIAMLSAPSAMPYWHPSAASTLLVSHVGDTRVILCATASGVAFPVTISHHPSSPVEANRLRRFSHTFISDSFGEERISGLANTRAFGDISAKRLGVSSEPQLTRIDIGPAEYSFLVLISDGVTNALTDQEICDVIKESRTPEQGAREVVSLATEVSPSGDNATCLAVRLGGWERRLEGGFGSMATKESRQWKREEANNFRRLR